MEMQMLGRRGEAGDRPPSAGFRNQQPAQPVATQAQNEDGFADDDIPF